MEDSGKGKVVAHVHCSDSFAATALTVFYFHQLGSSNCISEPTEDQKKAHDRNNGLEASLRNCTAYSAGASNDAVSFSRFQTAAELGFTIGLDIRRDQT